MANSLTGKTVQYFYGCQFGDEILFWPLQKSRAMMDNQKPLVTLLYFAIAEMRPETQMRPA